MVGIKVLKLWFWGGNSNNGSNCGLAYAASDNAWSVSSASLSARLAYYGHTTEVSAKKLAELNA